MLFELKSLICVVLYDFKRSSPLKLVVPEGGASERPGDCSSLSAQVWRQSCFKEGVFSSGRGVIFNLRTNDNFLCQIFSSPSLSFLSLCHLAGTCRSACFSLPSSGI